MFRRLSIFSLCILFFSTVASAGDAGSGLRVLSPITHGNLTIFAVI